MNKLDDMKAGMNNLVDYTLIDEQNEQRVEDIAYKKKKELGRRWSQMSKQAQAALLQWTTQ